MKTLWLASGSPRRLSMLRDAGFDPQRVVIDLDDDTLAEAVEGVESTCLARAWFKACAARHVLSTELGDLSRGEPGILLAADTLCESEGNLLGKPSDAQSASDMIRHLAGREHRTITGVALLDLSGSHRSIWSDSTLVRVGHLSDAQIQTYVESGAWQGKSGGYNLADRMADGWDIEIEGDPDTVMGLPMQELRLRLNELLSTGDS